MLKASASGRPVLAMMMPLACSITGMVSSLADSRAVVAGAAVSLRPALAGSA